jgi:hypothetical protein
MTRGAGDASCSSDLCVWQPLAPTGVLLALLASTATGTAAGQQAS